MVGGGDGLFAEDPGFGEAGFGGTKFFHGLDGLGAGGIGRNGYTVVTVLVRDDMCTMVTFGL